MPWISRADLDALRADLIRAITRATVLEQHAITHATQTAFLVGQINQLSKERVIMVNRITRLELPLPELAAVPQTPAISQRDLIAAMGSSMFDDMGDEEALREGITWDATGRLDYVAPKATPKGNGHG